MTSSIQDRVLAATYACLRPLAKMLLRSGVNYRQFSDIAKNAFLEEALAESDRSGRRPNTSRVAVRTGLSRKEVSRLREELEGGRRSGPGSIESARERTGHAARVLQIWHSDRRFLTATKSPIDLPFAGDDHSFVTLVRMVGGDVPPGAVKAELLAAGAVVETDQGLLRAEKRYFVPGDVGEDLVVGLDQIVRPVIEVLARNTGPLRGQPFFQRIAYSENLTPAAMKLFRHTAERRCEEFVQSVDDWLSENETAPGKGPAAAPRVGVGAFYFEESSEARSVWPKDDDKTAD